MSDFLPLEAPSPESTTLPFSREAEEAVIGAVFINPEAYYDVAQFLKERISISTAIAGSGMRSPTCRKLELPLTY